MSAIDKGDGAYAVRRLIEFDGRGGELFSIFIVNLLLTIVTLGVYRFWGKTRIRRYLWSHAAFHGDRLEYTGTGRELFIGFLIVIIVVFVPIGLVGYAFAAFAPDLVWIPQLLVYALIAYLVPVALYRARRYRLSRTQWRGVRGGQSGSAWRYGAMSLGYYAVTLLTFGLYWPAARVRLAAYRVNNSWAGDRRLAFEGRARPLYRSFFAVVGAYLLLMIALAVVTALIGAAVEAGAIASVSFAPAAAAEDGMIILQITPLISILVFLVPWYWYRAAEHRYFASFTRFETLRFTADVTGWALAKLSLGNGLILLVTLGLGLPWVYIRRARFFADRLRQVGEMDFDVVVQSSLAKPRTGEGLAEAFDLGDF